MKKKNLTSKRSIYISLLLATLVIGSILTYRVMSDQPQPNDEHTVQATIQTIETTSIDSQSCSDCHMEQFEDWIGSHHEQAMKEANSQTVLGDFNNATFTDGGVTSRFFQKENQFFVNTQGEDGQYADFEVKYTFGIQPLQQYLLEFPNGRLQAFTVTWDTEAKKWYSLYPDEQILPDDPIHWTGRFFTANSSCIECHTTNMMLNYDLETDSYDTTWDEINVGCQACHGPSEQHVQWAQGGAGDPIANKGFIVDYSSLEPQKQIENCADCHSRRYSVGEDKIYDHSFFDDFMPELLREGLYHADGRILDEVYVYGSFLQSKMYHEGVSCMSCHNPHSLELRQEGNQLCTSCHQSQPPTQQFETLTAKNYDTPEHHFHPNDTTGAACVNCHMPTQTYMIVDPRRDHSFSIPRPDLSLQWGTPNACTECHTDGQPLEILIQNSQQPAITRATALALARQYGTRSMALMAGALRDESPIVRAAALTGLENLSNPQKLMLIPPLLKDPVRGVRIEAAKVLATVPQADIDQEYREPFETSLAQYKVAQLARGDHPEGHLNLGNLYGMMGQMEQAESAFHNAIQVDQTFLPAHSNLANFYYQTGRVEDAEDTFRRALALMPNQGNLYYSLGLLLAEQQRLDEAAANLAKATELMPNQLRPHYNYGLLLQQLGQISQAEEVLLHAYNLAPSDSDTLIALATFYMQQERWEEGLVYGERLDVLNPNTPQIMRLLSSIRENISQK